MKSIKKYLVIFLIVILSIDLYNCADDLSATKAPITETSSPTHPPSTQPPSTHPPSTQPSSTHQPSTHESSNSDIPTRPTIVPITPKTSTTASHTPKPTTVNDSSTQTTTTTTTHPLKPSSSPNTITRTKPKSKPIPETCSFNITGEGFLSMKYANQNGYSKLRFTEDNVVITESRGLSLVLNRSDPNTILYTGAKVSNTDASFYGLYTCVMSPSRITGAISRCSVSNGDGINYAEIFFLIKADKDKVSVSVGTNVQSNLHDVPLTEPLPAGFSIFSFNVSVTEIIFYLNGRQVSLFKRNTIGDNAFPQPPFTFFTSIENNRNQDPSYIDLPTETYIKQLNYISSNCSAPNITADPYEFVPDSKSPLTYFTTKCTYDRIEWIFNDTLNDKWKDLSQSPSENNTESLEYIKRGEVSYQFDLRNNAYIYFEKTKSFSMKHFKFLIFWFNGGQKGGQQIMISVIDTNRTQVAEASLNDYVKGGIAPNTWYKVIIPLESLTFEPDVDLLKGFSFKPIVADQTVVYIDDMYLSNGTNCYESSKSLSFYNQGQLLNANIDGSNGKTSFNLKGTEKKYIDKKSKSSYNTIDWRLRPNIKGVINFENGSITPQDYDAFSFTLFFTPTTEYSYNFNENPDRPASPPKTMKASIGVRVGGDTYRPVGLSEYCGGEFPVGVWIEFTMPLADFGCGEGDPISSIELSSIGDDFQGAVFISKIQAVKYADPPKDDESSFAIKSNQIHFTFITLFILIFMFL